MFNKKLNEVFCDDLIFITDYFFISAFIFFIADYFFNFFYSALCFGDRI